ncbi:MAG: hypothetical protein ACKOCM_11600 [Cyanobacteriota bacterium]
MGDDALVEFREPLEAVGSAIAVQQLTRAREQNTPESCRIVLRIGINMGDVFSHGDDIFGDNVNIAARRRLGSLQRRAAGRRGG